MGKAGPIASCSVRERLRWSFSFRGDAQPRGKTQKKALAALSDSGSERRPLTERGKWNRGGAGPRRPRSCRATEAELRSAGADGARAAEPEVAREGRGAARRAAERPSGRQAQRCRLAGPKASAVQADAARPSGAGGQSPGTWACVRRPGGEGGEH